MKRVSTMKELEARYSGEWVLLVNPVHNELMEPIRGEPRISQQGPRRSLQGSADNRKDATKSRQPPDSSRGGCLAYGNALHFDPKAGIILVKTKVHGPRGDAIVNLAYGLRAAT